MYRLKPMAVKESATVRTVARLLFGRAGFDNPSVRIAA